MAFLADIVANQPRVEKSAWSQTISRRTKAPWLKTSLRRLPGSLHFRQLASRGSTRSSCGSQIERDVIARGVFASADLKRKLMRYIRHYKRNHKTVSKIF